MLYILLDFKELSFNGGNALLKPSIVLLFNSRDFYDFVFILSFFFYILLKKGITYSGADIVADDPGYLCSLNFLSFVRFWYYVLRYFFIPDSLGLVFYFDTFWLPFVVVNFTPSDNF